MRRLVNESLMRSIVGNMDRMLDYAGAGIRSLNESPDDRMNGEILDDPDLVAGDEIDDSNAPMNSEESPDMEDEEAIKGTEAEDENGESVDIDTEISNVCRQEAEEILRYIENGEKQIDSEFFIDDMREKLDGIGVEILADKPLFNFIENINTNLESDSEFAPDEDDIAEQIENAVHECGIKYGSDEGGDSRPRGYSDDGEGGRTSTKDLIGRDEDEGLRRGAPTIETQMARDADRALENQKHRVNALALSRLQDEVRNLGAKKTPFTLHDAIEKVIMNAKTVRDVPSTDKNGNPLPEDFIRKLRKRTIDSIMQRNDLIKKIKASVPNIDFDSDEKVQEFCSAVAGRETKESELGNRALSPHISRMGEISADSNYEDDFTGGDMTRRHGRKMKGATFSSSMGVSRIAQAAKVAAEKLAMAINPDEKLKTSVDSLNAFNADYEKAKQLRAQQDKEAADNERLAGFIKDMNEMIPSAPPSQAPSATEEPSETGMEETPQVKRIKDLIIYQGPKDNKIVETIDMILRAKRMWGYEKDADQSLFDENSPAGKMKQERKKKEEFMAEQTAGSYFRNLLMSDTVRSLTKGGLPLAPSYVLFTALAAIHDRQINHNAFSGNEEIDLGDGHYTYKRHNQNRSLAHRKSTLASDIKEAESGNESIMELLKILNRADRDYSNYDEFMSMNEDGKYIRILFANFGEQYNIYADRLTELARLTQARNMDEFVKFGLDADEKESKGNQKSYIGLVGSTDDAQAKVISSPEELSTIFKLWIGDDVSGLGGDNRETNEHKLLSLFPPDIRDVIDQNFNRLFVPEDEEIVSKIYAVAPDGTPYAYNPTWDPPIRSVGELSPRTANKAAKKKRGKVAAEQTPPTAEAAGEQPALEKFDRYTNLFNSMYRAIYENSL